MENLPKLLGVLWFSVVTPKTIGIFLSLTRPKHLCTIFWEKYPLKVTFEVFLR